MKKLVFIIPLMAISLLASCGSSKPEPLVTEYSISMVTEGATISPTTMNVGKVYNGVITVTNDEKILDGQTSLKSVKLKTSEKDITSYCTDYNPSDDYKSATFTIPADYITDDIEVEVVLVEVTTYSISMVAEGATISPSTINVPRDRNYVGTITIDSSNTNDILPASLNDVVLTSSDGVSIAKDCTYVRANDYKSATLTIPIKDLTDNITVDVTLEDSSKVWYLKDDWWNYCSNGEAGQQATIADVGQEVKTKVKGLDHKVRLIDIDHDTIASSSSKAHCTFEFANAVCAEGKPLETVRNDEGVNSIYINKALDKTSKSIVDMLDEQDLKDELKNVTKKVMEFPTGNLHQNDESDYVIDNFNTKMFPLAQSEMGGLQGYDPDLSKQEGDVYRYYNSEFYPEIDKRRIKLAVVGEIEHYWTRTPYPDASGEFGADHTATVINSSDGDIDQTYDADKLASIAPAFCI